MDRRLIAVIIAVVVIISASAALLLQITSKKPVKTSASIPTSTQTISTSKPFTQKTTTRIATTKINTETPIQTTTTTTFKENAQTSKPTQTTTTYSTTQTTSQITTQSLTTTKPSTTSLKTTTSKTITRTTTTVTTTKPPTEEIILKPLRPKTEYICNVEAYDMLSDKAVVCSILQDNNSKILNIVKSVLKRLPPQLRRDKFVVASMLASWVAEHIKYYNEKGEIVKTPLKTLREGGDCEDFALLVATLLAATGLYDKIVVIATDPHVDAGFIINNTVYLVPYIQGSYPMRLDTDYCGYYLRVMLNKTRAKGEKMHIKMFVVSRKGVKYREFDMVCGGEYPPKLPNNYRTAKELAKFFSKVYNIGVCSDQWFVFADAMLRDMLAGREPLIPGFQLLIPIDWFSLHDPRWVAERLFLDMFARNYTARIVSKLGYPHSCIAVAVEPVKKKVGSYSLAYSVIVVPGIEDTEVKYSKIGLTIRFEFKTPFKSLKDAAIVLVSSDYKISYLKLERGYVDSGMGLKVIDARLSDGAAHVVVLLRPRFEPKYAILVVGGKVVVVAYLGK